MLGDNTLGVLALSDSELHCLLFYVVSRLYRDADCRQFLVFSHYEIFIMLYNWIF